MNVKFEKNSPEYQWFGEFWRIVQEFWIPEKESEVYWKIMTDTIENFYQKYKGTEKLGRFCMKMNLAFLDFLAEECR